MPDDLALAVEVALVTGRPLLLRGDPGTGKSSLAAYLALKQDCRYYEIVVSSRTQPQDLLWSFDMVRRLADAQLRDVKPDFAYVEPGILWWALNPESASRRGLPPDEPIPEHFITPVEPFADLNEGRGDQASCVLLIDEIDKAEPDIPNAILVALGSNEFTVTETGTTVRRQPGSGHHLIIITTNEERKLPQAFLRRCVVIWLDHPDPDTMKAIIRQHVIEYDESRTEDERWTDDDEQLAAEIVAELGTVAKGAKAQAIRPPSVAEALDAFRACRDLGIRVGSAQWEQLTSLLLVKPQQPEG